MKFNIILIAFILFSCKLFSQKGTVLVCNADTVSTEQTIIVKWFIDGIWNEEGVNIYRKHNNSPDWEKLNSEPHKRSYVYPDKDYVKNERLSDFVEIANEAKEGELQSLLLLNILMETIYNNTFAEFMGILYYDTDISTGELYKYKVMKIVNGSETLLGESKEIEAGEFKPEYPVQDIKMFPGRRDVEVKWKPEENRYFSVDIFRSTTTDPIEIKANPLPIILSKITKEDGTETYPEINFTDDSLKNDVTYKYRFIATDYFGKKTRDTTVNVAIKDIEPPAPPINLYRQVDNFKITLTWIVVESEDLVGFNVYKSTMDTLYEKINNYLLPPTDSSFLDVVDISGEYFYYVAAVDKDGNEGNSVKLLIDIPDINPPAVPQNLTAEGDTGVVRLKWEAVIDEDLMGYIVFRRIKSKTNKEFGPLMADAVKTPFFTDTLSIIAKNRFEYKVGAIDSSYNISELSNLSSAKMPDILPPHKPKFIKTFINKYGVAVEWVPNKEPDLLGYNIYRYPKDSAHCKEQINVKLLSPKIIRFTDRFSKPGIVYYYVLCAIDNAGNKSLLSEPFRAEVIRYEMPEVSSIKKITLKYNSRNKFVRIKWKINDSEAFKGCVLFRKTDSTDFRPVTGLLKKEEFDDKMVKSSNKYYYRLKIYDNTGKNYKSDINEIIISNN